MNRIPKIEKSEVGPNVAALYDSVEKKLGVIPNMIKTMGNSYLNFSSALSLGKLLPSTREKIALLVAEENACSYCLSAHSAIGSHMKIPISELEAARNGDSEDIKEKAMLGLAKHILETRGNVAEHDYASAVTAGVTPEEATEIVGVVALNLLTNYFNRFTQTEIDFPKVEALSAVNANER
jgi:AhpD family alkylhydroperoxidase